MSRTLTNGPTDDLIDDQDDEVGQEVGDESGLGLGPRRRSRRRFLLAGGVATVLLIGGGVAVTRFTGGDDPGETPPVAATALGADRVEKRTLEEHTELDGTLGYGDVTDVGLPSGTVTALPAIGSLVDRGQTLVEIDGRPVPLLFGDRPLWRQLGPGADDGPDVQQLEANLVALGVVTESDLTVDQDWTAATTAAVDEWQQSLGLDDDGIVDPGDLVFLPGPVRVAEHPTPVGGQVGESVLGVTGSNHLVTVDLDADRQGLVEPRQAVDIVLPDGTETTGKVFLVGRVATSDDGGDGEDGGEGGDGGDGGDTATIDVVIVPDDPAATGTLDEAPVTVRVVTSAARDVLAVPVEALLAVADGGYAVEVVDDDGTTGMVPVDLGAFAGGWVQVTGDVAEGDEVVVPRD